MELNAEAILEELNEFEKGDQEVTPVLNEYLQKIAKTGNIVHPWIKLKPLLKRKMELVLADFCKSCPPDSIPSYPNTDKFEYERLKTSILEAVDYFQNAPFTIQRLCELITDPRKHYKRTDKYMRGLEKNLLVVSTIGRSDGDSSADRDLSASNDWANSDSSSEGHNYTDAATNVSIAAPAVNGTVLENFATVFPSATRIPNKANNIQVAIVTDTSAYQNLESVDDLEYEVIEKSVVEREIHDPTHDVSKSEPEEIDSELKACEEYYESSSASSDSDKPEVSSMSEDEECSKEKPTEMEECTKPAEVLDEEESDLSTSEAEKTSDNTEAEATEIIDKNFVSSTSDPAKESDKETISFEKETDSNNSYSPEKVEETDSNIDDATEESIAEPIPKRRKYNDSPGGEDTAETLSPSAESVDSCASFQPRGDSSQPSTLDDEQLEESEIAADKPTSTTN